jgi:succinyl-CoA synthetase beta subunit
LFIAIGRRLERFKQGLVSEYKMKLYEYSSKELFKKAGIQVPDSHLVAANSQVPDLDYPVMAKAQVLAGGRGKAGFIRKVTTKEEALVLLEEWLGKSHGGEKIKAILFEDIVSPDREIYLSIGLDGTAAAPVLMACGSGGVDIESVTVNKILRETINPMIGLQSYQIRKVVSFLGLEEQAVARFEALLLAVYNVFSQYQCELVEINPLILNRDGDMVVVDAKVVVDDRATVAIPVADATAEMKQELSLEDRLAHVGVNATEIGGDIVVITTGAGLGIATVDSLVEMGGSVKGFVDMGGVLERSAEVLGEYMGMIREWNPQTILITLYHNASDLQKMAQAIVCARKAWQPNTKVVIRIRGYRYAEAAAVLEANGLPYTKSYDEACRKAVEETCLF